jgi:hypothetical protein
MHGIMIDLLREEYRSRHEGKRRMPLLSYRP